MAEKRKPGAPPPPGKRLTFQQISRLAKAKLHEFTLISKFEHGYRNREDITNLSPGVLVRGSQNVLTNVSDRISIREGYTIDGQSNKTLLGIASAYDYQMHTGEIRHLRSYGTVMEYRYDNGSVITWRNLLTGLTSPNFNYCNYWDFNTELKSFVLMVNGTSNIWEWTGGVGTIASTTPNTITLSGTKTWAQMGFYSASTKSVVINGNTYTYTGGATTMTLTGVTGNPTGEVAGSIVHQAPVVTANSAMTAIPATFKNDLIGYLGTQVYIGSTTDNTVYISKQNNYKDYSFTAPTRVVGEGALVTLDDTTVGMFPQDDGMYFSAGQDFWYRTKFTLSSDLTKESVSTIRLKTTSLQGAQSQALISKIKNNIVYISHEPTLDELGLAVNITGAPQITPISDPVKLDFDDYDFTGGQVFYYRNFIYVSVPAEGLVRVYNIQKKYWEAPLTLPIARFSVIDGNLYGHDASVPQTYKLFDGYNDNGAAIDARAVFSYTNLGIRSALKDFNQFYIEGYVSSNVILNAKILYETGSFATNASYQILGNDPQIVAISPTPSNVDNSLGKHSFGKFSLGGSDTAISPIAPTPKFRVIKTFPNLDHYEKQISFTSFGKDMHWEILAFGDNSGVSPAGQNAIKQ